MKQQEASDRPKLFVQECWGDHVFVVSQDQLFEWVIPALVPILKLVHAVSERSGREAHYREDRNQLTEKPSCMEQERGKYIPVVLELWQVLGACHVREMFLVGSPAGKGKGANELDKLRKCSWHKKNSKGHYDDAHKKKIINIMRESSHRGRVSRTQKRFRRASRNWARRSESIIAKSASSCSGGCRCCW